MIAAVAKYRDRNSQCEKMALLRLKKKKSGRENATSWITGTKMDEMPTEKVKRGKRRAGVGERQKGVPWRVFAKLPSSAVEFE